MSDNVQRIGKRAKSFQMAPELDGYTKVVLVRDDDYQYAVGSNSGRTLTIECPLVTSATAPPIATNALNRIRGVRYKPFGAASAILDPAAELGDGITINSEYSGIFSMESHFGGLFTANVSAPYDEEIDHEFPYIAKKDRKVIRQLNNLSSELTIQSGLISAKVSRTGGDASSFGWELDESSWTIKASGRDILKATKDGLEVYGKITATSGTIGGFTIQSNALSTNSQTFGGTNTTGIYIGPSGIQLGKNFKVDSSGNLTAASGKFTGNVWAGKIQYGDDYGYFSGSGLKSGSVYGNRLVSNTITTAYTSSGINTSLGYADNANLVFHGLTEIGQIKVTGRVEMFGYKIGMKATAVATPSGGSTTLYYLTYLEA